MKLNLEGLYTHLDFAAAHMIIGHETCGRIHGHNYVIDVEIDGEPSGEFGFIIDFKILKSIIKNILKSLDHRILIPTKSSDIKITYQDDKTVEFTLLGSSEYKIPRVDAVLMPVVSTTAESLSRYITEEIIKELPDTNNLNYISIRVNEGIGQGATYTHNF